MNAPSTSALAIDVRGLQKRFGERHVVNNVSLQVGRGEIYGFLGPNGSGKTTCIRMLCGLLTPDAGSGTCLGFDIVRDSAEIKRHVGYMTQRFSFWEDLSIRENLDFVARIYGVKDHERAIAHSLDHLGLTHRASQLAGTLSGGWKQRLALAACLLHEPQLLLLDEPTAGVDPSARRDFWEELHRLAARGISVLVSTHYMDEAERCHKLAYIAWGELLAKGTASEITDSLGLSTCAIYGGDLVGIADRLRDARGVSQTVAFGSALHASGTDADTLLATIEATIRGTGARVKPIPTSLEHAFIFLMKSGASNSGAEGR
ncbi:MULTISPECIES: ABC transporter ATP-binding protein [Paraburkholderia]|uniref:ABC transporter ATP-binding protein n=1 Tax=Paraburkholderia TaxID=1822464 RepID=UPI00286A5DD9|nr:MULTISPECIES: ABC transporter ATP-binding protein [Paraburkholderia]